MPLPLTYARGEAPIRRSGPPRHQLNRSPGSRWAFRLPQPRLQHPNDIASVAPLPCQPLPGGALAKAPGGAARLRGLAPPAESVATHRRCRRRVARSFHGLCSPSRFRQSLAPSRLLRYARARGLSRRPSSWWRFTTTRPLASLLPFVRASGEPKTRTREESVREDCRCAAPGSACPMSQELSEECPCFAGHAGTPRLTSMGFSTSKIVPRNVLLGRIGRAHV